MVIEKNLVLKTKHKKPILLDYGYMPNKTNKPVIIFAHGFKGFKDWGHFNKMMHYFITQDFVFVKFNFSHNGGTVQQPIDFPDLNAFGNNNFSIELDDLRSVIDWVEENKKIPSEEIDKNEIYLIGHSRGGGISILMAREDKRIRRLVTWASVSDLINRLPLHQIEEWKEKGVIYIDNTRTKQKMPLYYQFATNTLDNSHRFSIEQAVGSLNIDHLIIHGTADMVVKMDEAKRLHSYSKNADLVLIPDGDHTFGSSHPFVAKELPVPVTQVLEHTLGFLKR